MFLTQFKSMRCVLLLTLLTLIQACATTQNQATNPSAMLLHQEHLQELVHIKQFTLKGRIGVQAEGKGFSGGISWQHTPELDEISLSSPLGGEVAHIQKSAANVSLTDSKGNSVSANNIESLTAKTLGWQFPLVGLADWALGRPTNSAVESSTWDNEGHLITLKQDGWTIEYQHYSTNTAIPLPHKMTLRNDKILLKLLAEDWFISSN